MIFVDYKTELEEMLQYLNIGSNIDYLEKVINNYVVANSEHDKIKFLNLRVELIQCLEIHTDTFLFYMNQNDLPIYEGEYQSVFKRLEALKRISRYNILQSDKALSQPFALKANIVSFSSKTPEDILLTLVNNNSESFETYLDFNGTLNVVNSLIENLNKKYDIGVNTIDAYLVDQLNKNFDSFMKKFKEIERNINRNQHA